MAGETNLTRLLGGMRPRMRDGLYVFAAIPPGQAIPATVDPVMMFREDEGRTAILTEEEARMAGLEATFRCRMITLEIHSALEAVGFLAAITTRLAAAGMGVNPVSAFYHDHLFVPADRADDAIAVLEQMAREA